MAEHVRKSTRFKAKAAVDVLPEPVPPSALPLPSQKIECTLSANAVRQRRFKEKLKADPAKHAIYKERDRQRAKEYRALMTPEQKLAAAQASVLRTRKCREKKKEQGLPLNQKPSKPATRAAILEKREYERARKAAYRASLSSHERAWILRKRREARRETKEKQVVQHNQSTPQTPANQTGACMNSSIQSSSSSSGYQNPSTSRKAVAKAVSNIPKSPSKYAHIVDQLTAIKSPRKRKALADKGILPPSSRRKLELVDSLQEVVREELAASSKVRNKKATERRRVLCGIFARYTKHRGCATHLKQFGTTSRFVKSCSQVSGRKKRKDALPAATVKKVQEFFEKGGISREEPAQSAVSSRSGTSTRYMEKTLREAYKEYLLENEDDQISFSKFSQLRPKSTKTTQHNKLKTCRCEYCMKVELRLQAINKFLAQKGFRQLTLANKDVALDKTLCARTTAFHQSKCVERKCGSCGVTALSAHFQPVLADHGESPATWEIWSNVTEEYRQNDGTLRSTKKWKPVEKEGAFKDLVTELEDEMKTFSLHIFQARWQHHQFSHIKENLPDNWLLLVSDFGQNYTCHHQDEIQGAHWCRSEATIHPTVAYYKREGKVVCHSFVFISNDLKHDVHAVHHYQMTVTNTLLSEGFSFHRIIHFSDGCASQYKGKTNIVDLSHAEEDTGILTELHYFGSRHGKGPCDAEIGVLKKNATLAVKRRAPLSRMLAACTCGR